VLQRLCEQAGVPTDTADRIAAALAKAWGPPGPGRDDASIPPQRVSQLAWLGIDAETIAKLEPWVIVLPGADAKVNINTAPAEVIAAAVEGMSLGAAQRLVTERQRTPLRDVASPPARGYFPADPKTRLDGLSVSSRFFIVQGRLRLGERVLEERSLIERRQLEVLVLQRERLNLRDGP